MKRRKFPVPKLLIKDSEGVIQFPDGWDDADETMRFDYMMDWYWNLGMHIDALYKQMYPTQQHLNNTLN